MNETRAQHILFYFRLAEEGAVGNEPCGSGGGQGRMFHNPLTPMDFPALAGSSSATPSQYTSPAVYGKNNNRSKLNMDEFPSLGKH